MRLLIVAVVLALLITSRFADAQHDHGYMPTAEEDQNYNPLGGERYPNEHFRNDGHDRIVSEVTPASTMEVVNAFMIEAGFGDKWWSLEKLIIVEAKNGHPKSVVVDISIEGKNFYTLLIVNHHIVGIRRSKSHDSDAG